MKPYYSEAGITIYAGDAAAVLRSLPPESVNCCVTSPPYWGLRDYGSKGQIGLESRYEEYVCNLVSVFSEVRRLLRGDGTLWLNLGDSFHNGDKGGYAKDRVKAEDSMQRSNLGANFIGAPNRQPQAGLKPKDLCGIPWRVAFALQADGWYFRSDIIWSKPNPRPESVTDRPTRAHEYLFLLAKSERYYYDHEAIAEPSVSDHGSGNGFKREARLSYMDDDGPRGNDKPWVPKGTHSHAGQGSSTRKFRSTDSPRIHGNLPGRSDGGAACNRPGQITRNRRSVWTINTQPFPEAHFATFPEDLVRPCILAGCPTGGVVLDPFAGAGTTLLVARKLSCQGIGIELNQDYVEIAAKRLAQGVLDFELPGTANESHSASATSPEAMKTERLGE